VPPGWLAGSAWWSDPGTLRLPYARPELPYGVKDVATDRYGLPPSAPVRRALPPAVPVSRVLPLQQVPSAALG
jgi:hypothetical protein